MADNIRRPAVAGTFYPESGNSLKVALDNLMEVQLEAAQPAGEMLGLIVPHAGYVYSGRSAAAGYSQLKGSGKRRFIVIGPNHSSFPHYSAIYPSGQWITPLGSVAIDERLGKSIVMNCSSARLDASPHTHEHSVEVQFPFLQYMFGNDISISPIIMGRQNQQVAHQMAQAILKLEEDFLIIASSDLNHYEGLEITIEKDQALLDAILSLDVDEFYRVLDHNEVSACGYGPIAVLMEYTKEKGGELGLLSHTTSSDASGDRRNVVGYCSIKSSRQF